MTTCMSEQHTGESESGRTINCGSTLDETGLAEPSVDDITNTRVSTPAIETSKRHSTDEGADRQHTSWGNHVSSTETQRVHKRMITWLAGLTVMVTRHPSDPSKGGREEKQTTMS